MDFGVSLARPQGRKRNPACRTRGGRGRFLWRFLSFLTVSHFISQIFPKSTRQTVNNAGLDTRLKRARQLTRDRRRKAMRGRSHSAGEAAPVVRCPHLHHSKAAATRTHAKKSGWHPAHPLAHPRRHPAARASDAAPPATTGPPRITPADGGTRQTRPPPRRSRSWATSRQRRPLIPYSFGRVTRCWRCCSAGAGLSSSYLSLCARSPPCRMDAAHRRTSE